MIACGHGPVVGLTLNDIDAKRRGINFGTFSRRPDTTHTPSKRYARPCCPLNAYGGNREAWSDERWPDTDPRHHGVNGGEMGLAR